VHYFVRCNETQQGAKVNDVFVCVETDKVKAKLALCLTKYHAPEDVLEEWRH